jgi:hypothetical protein
VYSSELRFKYYLIKHQHYRHHMNQAVAKYAHEEHKDETGHDNKSRADCDVKLEGFKHTLSLP